MKDSGQENTNIDTKIQDIKSQLSQGQITRREAKDKLQEISSTSGLSEDDFLNKLDPELQNIRKGINLDGDGVAVEVPPLPKPLLQKMMTKGLL